jgi:hypothetical protein
MESLSGKIEKIGYMFLRVRPRPACALLALLLAVFLGLCVSGGRADDRLAQDGASEQAPDADPVGSQRAAMVRGYHGYNAALLEAALAAQGVAVQAPAGWLDLQDYPAFALVILDGNLERQGVQPARFSPGDLKKLRAYLHDGGVLVVFHQGLLAFRSEHGQAFLREILGQTTQGDAAAEPVARHPWVEHLQASMKPTWATGTSIACSPGHALIRSGAGQAVLCQAPVGRGRFVFLGWDLFRHRPPGRSKDVTPQQEQAFNDQILILHRLAQELFPRQVADRPARQVYDHPTELGPADSATALPAAPVEALTHRPMRALPAPTSRAIGSGPGRYVDATRGDDAAAGDRDQPWRTLQHAAAQLRPGDTLYLRGGIYREKVALTLRGRADAPITVRAYPGELAILDGGIAAFQLTPALAWEPCPDGVEGEFRSTVAYPGLPGEPDYPRVVGHFADSMVPLHGYRFRRDLQSDHPYWSFTQKDQAASIYCGPGVWYNPDTQRIHVRLAHTRWPALGDDNYRGPTDPRAAPLIVAHADGGPVLQIQNSTHLRVEDLVVRGSRLASINVLASSDITLNGVTVYGGSAALAAAYTHGLRVIHSVFRGAAAPWTFRSSLKYRGMESRLVITGSSRPLDNRDFELAYCEFTDSIDGVMIGAVADLRFHHNLLDHCVDDGLFLTALPDDLGQVHGGPILIYQNVFSRCLTTLAFGVGHSRQPVTDGGVVTGRGVWVFRNLFDLRRPVRYFPPTGPDDPHDGSAFPRSQGDHGSPVWERMALYHNTVVSHGPGFRDMYGHGWGGSLVTPARVVLNNIFVQQVAPMGAAIAPGSASLLFDANLHWSLEQREADAGGFATRMAASIQRALAAVSTGGAIRAAIPYPDGDATADALADLLTLHAIDPTPLALRGRYDLYADPQLAQLSGPGDAPLDIRLTAGSPAIDRGLSLPPRWPDPCRDKDAAAPDLGALPSGSTGWRYGVRGRLHLAAPTMETQP